MATGVGVIRRCYSAEEDGLVSSISAEETGLREVKVR